LIVLDLSRLIAQSESLKPGAAHLLKITREEARKQLAAKMTASPKPSPPVSRTVNSVNNDNEECIEPIGEPPLSPVS
jgi:hypothetical protein